MKTAVTAVLVAAFTFAFPMQRSYAGDKEWATAGKILAGAVGFAILNEIVNDSGPHYVRVYEGRPVYRVPVTHYVAPPRIWVPGRYVTTVERRWVPGYCERVWVAAQYRDVWVPDPCGGHWARALVSEGHYETIQHPGHYEEVPVQQWLPGHYEYR